MFRKAYDEERIGRLAPAFVAKQHRDWTEEQIMEAAKTKEWRDKVIFGLTIQDFANKIEEIMGGTWNYAWCYNKAERIMLGLPEDLIQNVNEYLDDKPLTDIKVHGVSLLDIMNQFGKNRPIPILAAMQCMVDWKKTGFYNKSYCKTYFTSH